MTEVEKYTGKKQQKSSIPEPIMGKFSFLLTE
jgi:hypothetical protein